MNPYSAVVFLHVLSATGIVAALALEGLTLLRVSHAPTPEVARDRLGGISAMQWVGLPATVLVLLTGGYLSAQWGMKAEWLRVAFPAFFLLPVLGATLTRKGLGALQHALAAAAPSGPSLGKGLWLSCWLRVGVVVAIVFLMEVKPPLIGALWVLAIALAAGGVAGLVPATRRAVR